MTKRRLLAILGTLLAALGAILSKGVVVPCDPPAPGQQGQPTAIPITAESSVVALQTTALK